MSTPDNFDEYASLRDDLRQMMETSLGRTFRAEEGLSAVAVRAALSDTLIRLDEAERDMNALKIGTEIPDSKLDYPAMYAVFTLSTLVNRSEDPTT